ncbi:oxidoreductase FAD/NAD(P)-binding domain protein [Chloroherpeton thalassium ATCC 35110]|uniref:Oxidoreductase FAD/NAD(P)-binding domain protein n=2 Tax=Chloroherpeton thalassium TaxID=100716 RepID=B3QU19_CHLT3|nr:oxidoreductase FAD/NAD(P)-binding domain protein [Chloroherpeton thalassium ATCC 35110]
MKTEYQIPKQDVNLEPFMSVPPQYTRKMIVMKTDKVYKCKIINVIKLTELEKLFHLRIVDQRERDIFQFRPGQFVMLDVPGYGEVPISLSSSTNNHEYIELCIRKAGRTTNVLHEAKIGSYVGIRGPFGNSFPMEKMAGHNILLIAGGLGIAPLRGPLYWVADYRDHYKDVHVLYGAKEPSQMLFTYQYDEWERVNHIKMLSIVEHPDENWTGHVGRITKLFDEIEFDPQDTFAIVCGPPVMFKFVCSHLDKMGIPMNRMFVSLERRMHCGMGKCCRCMVGSTFTCVDGPVFDYWSVLNLKEAI